MHFKLKNKITALSFLIIGIVFGQQYFSPLIPNNYFSSGASYLAKGGIYSGPFSKHIFNRYGKSVSFEVDIIVTIFKWTILVLGHCTKFSSTDDISSLSSPEKKFPVFQSSPLS